MTAEPVDQPYLRLGEEIRDIEAEMRRTCSEERFSLRWSPSLSPFDIQREITTFKPDIVHFSGHGMTNGALCFEDRLGKTYPVETKALAALFQQVRSYLKCVVLNACYSDEQAKVISQHIPYVIGMTRAISDKAAIRFAVGFYGALAAGSEYEKAYESACVQIQLERHSEELIPVLRRTQDHSRKVFYSERPEIEEACYRNIQELGALLRIKAAKSMGKTWLMRRIVEKGRSYNYRNAVLSFNSFLNKSISEDIDKFLKAFCISITKELGLTHDVEKYWQGLETSIEKATDYFQRCILDNDEAPLLLALNHVDAVFEKPVIAQDFCQMLRNWHEFARQGDYKSHIWERLRLIIVHSTDVYAAFNINASPLSGVGMVVRLPELNTKQVKTWIEHHNLNFDENQIQQLIILLGGHPFLLKRAINYFETYNPLFTEFISNAATLDGPFDGHLKELLEILNNQPLLKKGFRQVVQQSMNQPIKLNIDVARKLCCLGLTKWQHNNLVVRCQLYYDFFHNHLQ